MNFGNCRISELNPTLFKAHFKIATLSNPLKVSAGRISVQSFSVQTWNWLSLSWGIFQVSRSDTFICGSYIIFVIYSPIWLPVILNLNCKSSLTNRMDLIQNYIEYLEISWTPPTVQIDPSVVTWLNIIFTDRSCEMQESSNILNCWWNSWYLMIRTIMWLY